MKIYRLLQLLPAFLAFSAAPAFSQDSSGKERARILKDEAIRLMDDGNTDRAIEMLASAQKLDPDNFVYDYETGYAYYLKKDYAKAAVSFQKTLGFSNSTDQCFQMLGNAYDMNGERTKARNSYNEGLRKFPSSGRLYMESGLIEEDEKNYDKAIQLWEKGVQFQPDYPSNYYRLAKLFSRSTERLWAAFYGELFMNIERGSERTAEISRLLFDVYKKSIIISDTGWKLDMTSNTISLNGGKFKIPFKLVYTLDLTIGLTAAAIEKKKELSIDVLNKARVTAIDLWYQKNNEKEYPNIILEFHHDLKEKGYLEAYNYWLLSKGNEKEFDEWRTANQGKFDAFIAWFKDNPLKLDKSHFLVRTQYD